MSDVRLPEPLSFEGNVAENFRKFKQSFEIYLIASGKVKKEDKVKIALLLNLMGEEGLEVYNTLKLNEEDKYDFDKVITEFEKYMTPRKNVVYERFLFYNRKQDEGEPFDHFLTDLKKLSKTCDFGDSCDSMIRDRIVFGIQSLELQERLLHAEDLTLDKAVDKCRANELARAQLKEVQSQEGKVQAIRSKKVIKQSSRSSNEDYTHTKSRHFGGNRSGNATVDPRVDHKINLFDCRSCGFTHGPRKCPAFGRMCNKCKKYGHFEKVCRSQYVREIFGNEEDEENQDEDMEEYLVTTIMVNEVTHKNEWIEKVSIDEQNINFKVDTGSQVNIIPLNILQKIHYQ